MLIIFCWVIVRLVCLMVGVRVIRGLILTVGRRD